MKRSAHMKICLTAVGILVLISGIAAGFFDHESMPWAGIVGSFMCLAFANIDRIESFKASRDGFEAKTRAVIREAKDTLAELQILATHLAEISLTLVKRSGRIGGYPDDEQEQIKEEMLVTLSKLGIADGEFPIILKQWHRFEALDYVFGVLGNSQIPDGATNEIITEWKALRSDAAVNQPTDAVVLRAFLDRHGFMTNERLGYLADYEHFVRSKSHRRPEVWKDRRNWGHLKREPSAV